MKTKQTTKERREIREFKTVNHDMKNDYEITILDSDILDEVALAEIIDDDDDIYI